MESHKGSGKPVTQPTRNNIMHQPVQHMDPVQTRTKTIHSRLVIQAQP